MMKIAFVHLNRYRDLGSTDFFELSQAFGRLLPGTVYVIVGSNGESQAGLAGSVILHEIPISKLGVWNRASIDFYFKAASLLCSIEAEIVVVTFDRGAALIPMTVRRRLGKAAPIFVHHVCSVSFATNPLRYWVGNLLTKFESYVFDAVSVLSTAISKEIYRFGFSRPIHIIPIGINSARFFFQAEARTRWRNGIDDNEVLFVYVGTLCMQKNVDHIVDAFAKANLGSAARLWMVGDGPMMEALETLIESRFLSNIYLLGRRDYDVIPEILSAADVSISHIENTSRFYLQPPIKVLEYLAAGTTVLASDVPGNRFYLDNCDASRFYEPSGVEALASAFQSVVIPKHELFAAGRHVNAKKTVEAYNWDRIAFDALKSLTNELIKNDAKTSFSLGVE
ncbi:MAG: glycosyltransferase [Terracidiphilus sp.]